MKKKKGKCANPPEGAPAMDTSDSTGLSMGIDERAAQLPSVPSTLELDAARYSAYLDDFDMTEEQGRALLETLWSIMRTFVEMGFSVNVCDAVFANSQIASSGAAIEVECPHSPNAKSLLPQEGERTDSR